MAEMMRRIQADEHRRMVEVIAAGSGNMKDYKRYLSALEREARGPVEAKHTVTSIQDLQSFAAQTGMPLQLIPAKKKE